MLAKQQVRLACWPAVKALEQAVLERRLRRALARAQSSPFSGLPLGLPLTTYHQFSGFACRLADAISDRFA